DQETFLKMSNSKLGENNPMYGINHSEDTKIMMGIPKKGIPLTDAHKVKLSLAKKGISISDFHKMAISIAMKDRIITESHKAKISEARKGILLSEEIKLKMSKKVYIYSNNNPPILLKEFNSCSEAINYLSCSKSTISKYIDTNKIYLNKWKLLSSLLNN